jgi:hypothetical protein
MEISTLTFEQIEKKFRLMQAQHIQSVFTDGPTQDGEKVNASGCSQFHGSLGHREVDIEIHWKLTYDAESSYADEDLDLDGESAIVIRGFGMDRIEDNLYMCRFEPNLIVHGAKSTFNQKLARLVGSLPISTYALIMFLEHQDSHAMIAA